MRSVLLFCKYVALGDLKFMENSGTSLAVQWLRLRAPTAGGVGLIPDWGTKIPHAAQRRSQKNKLNK